VHLVGFTKETEEFKTLKRKQKYLEHTRVPRSAGMFFGLRLVIAKSYDVLVIVPDCRGVQMSGEPPKAVGTQAAVFRQ
jgi:hypothetical protein